VAGDDQHTTPLVLASGSPRRAELLALLGHPFDIFRPEVDETVRPAEEPITAVKRLARDKVNAGRAAFPSAIVVAADTLVVLDGELLGKPRDGAEAARMLRRLSGRAHLVFTGYAVAAPSMAHPQVAHAETSVRLRSLSKEEIAGYVATGEPLDKAGAYAIQGRAAAFVEAIEGSYTNVVGLPLAELAQLLRRIGLEIAWRRTS
jgi:septum formation protein